MVVLIGASIAYQDIIIKCNVSSALKAIMKVALNASNAQTVVLLGLKTVLSLLFVILVKIKERLDHTARYLWKKFVQEIFLLVHTKIVLRQVQKIAICAQNEILGGHSIKFWITV